MVGAQSLPRWIATNHYNVLIVPLMYHTSCCRAVKAIHHVLSGSSASSATPVFVHLRGDVPIYTSPFETGDTLYLVLLTSRGEVPWCGRRLHYRLLGAISESCVVLGDQCSYPQLFNMKCAADRFTQVLLLSCGRDWAPTM